MWRNSDVSVRNSALRRMAAAGGCRQETGNQLIQTGYQPYEGEIERLLLPSVRAARGGLRAAPIGAMVFVLERLKQARTGVYDHFCRIDPVDTCIAVDKLKKSKKGFYFDEFEGFERFRPSTRSRIRPVCQEAWEEWGASDEEKKAGMIGGPTQMTPRRIGSHSERGAQQRSALRSICAIAVPARPQTRSACARLESVELPDSADLLEYHRILARPRGRVLGGLGPSPLRVSRGGGHVPPSANTHSPRSHGAFHRQLAYLSVCSCGARIGCAAIACKRIRAGGWLDAAQPLQYSMGRGWDDRSAPQDFAGWAHARDR